MFTIQTTDQTTGYSRLLYNGQVTSYTLDISRSFPRIKSDFSGAHLASMPGRESVGLSINGVKRTLGVSDASKLIDQARTGMRSKNAFVSAVQEDVSSDKFIVGSIANGQWSFSATPVQHLGLITAEKEAARLAGLNTNDDRAFVVVRLVSKFEARKVTKTKI